MPSKIDNYLLIIGAMKAGTTYLYELLAQHPEIASCLQKEPCFFADPPGYETWPKGMDYYRSLWPGFNSKTHKYAMDGSVNNTKVPEFPNAAERIASVKGASFRFIYVVRNPLERIRSHLQFMEIYRRREKLPAGGAFQIDQQTLHVTQYHRQISEYYRRFPRENIRIIFFEDLIYNPQDICEKIFTFLEIPCVKLRTDKGKNDTAGRSYKNWVFKLRQKVPLRLSLQKILPEFVKNRLIDKDITSFHLSEEQIRYALNYLKPDLDSLQEEFGVDIGKWRLPI